MISCANLHSSTPLRNWICPSLARDIWRTRVWPSCTNHPQPRVCMWLQQRTWWAESPLYCYFWLETQLQRPLTCTASTGILISRWAALTQQRWTAGGAAMSVRLTGGCGKFGVASHAWVASVSQWRRLKKGSKLTGMNGTSVQLRLVGGARRIPDSKWSVVVNSVYSMYILVYTTSTSISNSDHSISQTLYIMCFFHFRQGIMLYCALDRYQLILKHRKTVPLYENC